uniref:Uncharacterized protein n=1 Tax=Tanacetum cinerariifolium TaxID=118510 RepID=A0A699L4P7_TANCI|nr:hypothetical protein [Tanacetum cinerariifolium]
MSDDRVFYRPCTCERCRRNNTDKFCSICYFESGNAFINELTANYFDDLLNSSDHPTQHQTHSFESYNDNPNYGYPPQEPFVYNQDPCYEQNFVDNSQSPPQPQYETYACELVGTMLIMVTIVHLNFRLSTIRTRVSIKTSIIIFHKLHQVFNHNTFVVRTAVDRMRLFKYINSSSWNRPAFYDNDYDEYSIQVSKKSPIAIAPVLPTEKPDNSLSMGDEHLDTIPEMKSDEVIKSSVEDLVPIPSESEGTKD